MDSIFYNAVIHTMNGDEVVSAIAIKDGLVAEVGGDEEILALKTEGTKLVDLEKKLVVPGFNDSHLHILGYGMSKRSLDLNGCESVQEIVDRGRAYLSRNPDVKFIAGRGWNQDYYPGRVAPTKTDLDAISDELPILLHRVCGHSAVVNSRALSVFGIDENTIPPEGGSFDLASGLFCDAALGLFTAPLPSVAEMKGILREATRDMLERGITSAQSDDFGGQAYRDVIQAYTELADEGELSVRVYQQCRFAGAEEVGRFFADSRDIPADGPFFRLGPIKLMADGSLGARTAYLTRPYHDDESTSGLACITQDEMDAIVALCQQNGRAVAVHCIGDGALRMTLDSVEKAQKVSAERPRHGIVHCQITDAPLLERLRELGMLVYIQPIFLHYDLHIAEKRVGEELAKTSYNFKTLCDLGVVVSLGTDCPVESFDPLENIYSAVTRKDLRGFPEGGYYPEQALSVHEAVYGYTAGSAYCSYEENVKGRLKKGFLADMAVLDRDIFRIDPAEIKDTCVAMTVLGGRIAYTRA